MSKLQAIQVDENTIIYVEATDTVATPVAPVASEPEEVGRTGQKGWGGGQSSAQTAQTQVAKSFQAIESTIRTYTKFTLNAFNDAALANVEKVTLEFGMNVSGAGGVPYIAAGTVGCNIKVTVECNFPQQAAEYQAQLEQQTRLPQATAQPGQVLSRQPQPGQPIQGRAVQGQPMNGQPANGQPRPR